MRLIAFLLSALLITPLARAEGVESRINLPSSAARISGVQTLVSSSWGLFTLGGSALRWLPTGKSQWKVLHRVPGGNLYRATTDDSGRLLASWETEKKFHLFFPGSKKHLTFLKPPRSQEGLSLFTLDGFNFSKDGRAAIVFMAGTSGGSTRTTTAYRYQLDGKGEPTPLFHQAGLKLFTSDRVGLFTTPKNGDARWDSRDGLSFGEILAYEITGGQVVKRSVFSGERENWSVVRMAGGTEEDGLAVLLLNEKKERFLLRWRLGQAKATLQPLPKFPATGTEKTLLTKTGDLVEIWKTEEEGLEVKRHLVGGGIKVTKIPAPPTGDPDIALDTKIHSVRECRNGDLLIHFGDHLVLLSEKKTPRTLNIEPLLARLDEWASADIYTPAPEALWLGVEVGAGRDFVRLGLDDFKKRAKPVDW